MVLSRRYDALQPSHRASFPSLGGTSDSLVLFAPWRTSEPPKPGVDIPVTPAGNSPRSEQGSPKFLGNLSCPFAMFQSDSGGTTCARPLRHSSAAPGMQKAEAPTKGLSELNSMAFGLAVYASPGSLPHHDARLASSCWSGSTGRDSLPQGSVERFQSCKLHLIPLSQALLGAIASTDRSCWFR